MMIYKLRVKPFDVLVINRIPKMTSAVCATQLVDKCQVKRKKDDPELTKNHQRKIKCHLGEYSTKTIT